jgi:hypothetical protein
MFNGPYVMINQLIKVHTKECPSKFFFIIHVRGKKISIQQKMTKIGTFENKAQIWSFKSS